MAAKIGLQCGDDRVDPAANRKARAIVEPMQVIKHEISNPVRRASAVAQVGCDRDCDQIGARIGVLVIAIIMGR
ncbi:hypothetical protein GCM10011329_00970 [Stakelama pacifica]|nr:hypothetical protein GCM10011329_00970 [Stakelama pacifica]